MAPSSSDSEQGQSEARDLDPSLLQHSLRAADLNHPALARLRHRLDRNGLDPELLANYSREYSRSCFPAGTEVLLADGSTTAIEQISVGDAVMSFDGSNPVPVSVEAVESPVRDHHYILSFADGSTIRLTQEHPLYTNNGWRSLSPESTAEENATLLVGKLEIGDQVLTATGEYRILVSASFVPGDVQTYNITKLSQHEAFYANGFLTHNKAQVALCGKCTTRFADFACLTSAMHCLPPPGQLASRVADSEPALGG